MIRHHRLIEAFLADALGMPWDRVHDEAEVLEHYISEDLERLDRRQARQPDASTPTATRSRRPSSPSPWTTRPRSTSFRPEPLATFARVSDSDPRMLRYLDERGIRPGVALRVTDVQPFGGPVFVEVDGKEHALGGELAEKMRVEPAGSA